MNVQLPIYERGDFSLTQIFLTFCSSFRKSFRYCRKPLLFEIGQFCRYYIRVL